MTLQLLVSCVKQNIPELIKKMNISSDAIIINQGMPYSYTEFRINKNTGKDTEKLTAENAENKNAENKSTENKNTENKSTAASSLVKVFNMNEKGVGLSRTTALQRATADISLFSDEDIVYVDDYERLVVQAFEQNPGADMILFNVRVAEDRKTYWTTEPHRVHRWNCGRYPAYSIAVRTGRMHEMGLTYHTWFGGGAQYSCGEDSLFLNESLKKGLKLLAVPICIGEEVKREEGEASTWFKGYNEKFFYDRGVLYRYLYGKLAPVMTLRFLLKNKATMCQEITYKEALKLMQKGYKNRQENQP